MYWTEPWSRYNSKLMRMDQEELFWIDLLLEKPVSILYIKMFPGCEDKVKIDKFHLMCFLIILDIMVYSVSYFIAFFRKIFTKYLCILCLGFCNLLIIFLFLFDLMLKITDCLLN